MGMKFEVGKVNIDPFQDDEDDEDDSKNMENLPIHSIPRS